MSNYYIMNAGCLFNECATDIAGVIETWGKDQTILVCRRQTKYGQPLEEGARIFVSGAGQGYESAALPINSFYTQDTGMGHKYEGYGLYIENIIEVKGDRIKPRNTIGLTERRRAWTMK